MDDDDFLVISDEGGQSPPVGATGWMANGAPAAMKEAVDMVKDLVQQNEELKETIENQTDSVAESFTTLQSRHEEEVRVLKEQLRAQAQVQVPAEGAGDGEEFSLMYEADQQLMKDYEQRMTETRLKLEQRTAEAEELRNSLQQARAEIESLQSIITEDTDDKTKFYCQKLAEEKRDLVQENSKMRLIIEAHRGQHGQPNTMELKTPWDISPLVNSNGSVSDSLRRMTSSDGVESMSKEELVIEVNRIQKVLEEERYKQRHPSTGNRPTADQTDGPNAEKEEEKEELEKLEKSMAELEMMKMMASRESSEGKMSKEMEHIKKQKFELEEANVQLKARLESAEERDKSLVVIRADCSRLEEEKEKLQMQVQQLVQEWDKEKGKVSSKDAKLKQLQAQCDDLRQAKDEVAKERDDIKRQLDGLNADLQDQIMNDRTSQHETAIQTLRTDNETLKKEKADLMTELEHRVTAESTLTADLEELRRQVAGLEKDRNEALSLMTVKEAELSTARADVESCQLQLHQLSAEMEQLMSDHQQLLRHKMKSEKIVNEAEEKVELARLEASTYKEDFDAERQARQEAVGRADQLAIELTELKQENDVLLQELQRNGGQAFSGFQARHGPPARRSPVQAAPPQPQPQAGVRRPPQHQHACPRCDRRFDTLELCQTHFVDCLQHS